MNKSKFDRSTAALAMAVLFMSAGCVSKKVYVKETQRADQLKTQSDTLTAQILALQNQIKTLQSNLDASQANNAELMKTLDAKKGELNDRMAELTKQNQEFEKKLRETEQAKQAEIDQLKGSYDQLVNGLKSELAAGQVTITQLKGRLSVNMVDKILFNSGEAQVKPAGFKVLDRVGEVLKKIEDKDIRVEGHTDNVPISASLQAKYPTNWELSTDRATAVVRYLQEKAGIPANRLIASGYGDTHPVASNATPEGRQENRRIEIVLVPNEAPAATPPANSAPTKQP
jgi:chemotaxis protein MotB